MRKFVRPFAAAATLLLLGPALAGQEKDPLVAPREISIPTIDISTMVEYQSVIVQGTPETMQGNSNTILMPDGKTIYLIWVQGKTPNCNKLKRSDDGGLTWSEELPVPENWSKYHNCPPLYLLKDPQGKERLVTYTNRTPYGLKMGISYSEDEGKTWTPFEPVMCADGKDTLVADVMPFTSIIPIEGGKRLLGACNLRRPFFPTKPSPRRDNLVAQCYSDDGGLSWTRWRIVLDLDPQNKPCEPEIFRTPDGEQLVMLVRDNNRDYNSWIMTSRNEGKTWEGLRQLPASITMDRHKVCWLPDGRLIIVGRDVAGAGPSRSHFVAWVGTLEDLLEGREGQYRIKMLHTYKGTLYPGLTIFPDGTVFAVTSLVYRKDENFSVVGTRFNIADIDEMYSNGQNFMPPKKKTE